MAEGEVKVDLLDGQLLATPAGSDQAVAIIGHCTAVSSGVYSYTNATVTKVSTDLGRGRLAEATATLLGQAGHGTVIALPVPVGANGTISAFSQSGTGPLPTITGTPNDSATLKARIVTGGTVGTATFQVDLGGGKWGPVTATAATTLISSLGVTIAWTAGTYVANEVYTANAVAPTLSASDVVAAIDRLRVQGLEVSAFLVLSQAPGAADTDRAAALVTVIDAVAVKMASEETLYRYGTVIHEAPKPVATDSSGMASWRAALNAALVGKLSKENTVTAGQSILTSPLDYRKVQRPVGLAFAWKFSGPIHEHFGRVASGAIPAGLVDVATLDHDENVSGGLNAARISTVCTHAGKTGAFVKNCFTLADPSSDFSHIQRLRVINRGRKVLRNALLQYLNETLQPTAAGTIDPAVAQSIEDTCYRAMAESLLPAHAARVRVVVDRQEPITTTNRLVGYGAIQPKGEAREISFTLSFAARVEE